MLVTFRVKNIVSFCVKKLLHFALKSCYILRQKLLHFGLMYISRQKLLHFALTLHLASIVTFCGVTGVCYPLSSMPLPFFLPPYPLHLSTPALQATHEKRFCSLSESVENSCWLRDGPLKTYAGGG